MVMETQNSAYLVYQRSTVKGWMDENVNLYSVKNLLQTHTHSPCHQSQIVLLLNFLMGLKISQGHPEGPNGLSEKIQI